MPNPVPDPWHRLRESTPARIALGRAGGSLPTCELLQFQLDHARARDAVRMEFVDAALGGQISDLGHPVLRVRSQAADRSVFLKRPDLGRRLDAGSESTIAAAATATPPDLVIIVTDGLSAAAAHAHAVPLLAILLPRLARHDWLLAPIVVARFGRVALQDPIGEQLHARIALSLIGERPGLGSPDSLGAYLVHSPTTGLTDARRNCVSNIHARGLSHAAAADTILWLLNESRRRSISGVALKNDMPALPA